jgi:hypothetical protein
MVGLPLFQFKDKYGDFGVLYVSEINGLFLSAEAV